MTNFTRLLALPFLALSFLVAVAAPALAAQQDLGPRLARLAATGARPNAQALRRVRIVLVPGFMNESMRRSSGTYEDQVAALAALGLREGTDFVQLTEREGYVGVASLASCAQAVARAIAASPRPVLLVSQSKGSMSALAALIAYPAARARVAGWFSIQGAFGGSPIADGVESSSDNGLIRFLLAGMGGSPNAVTELTRSVRRAYLAAHRADVAALIAAFPIVTYASYQAPSKLPWMFREMDARWCGRACQTTASDGVVLTVDEYLPGASYAIASGVDHGDTTMAGSGFDRRGFTNAFLALMLGESGR